MRRVIFDTPNILFRVAAANSRYNNGTAEDKAGLAMHISLNVFQKHYKALQPDQIAVVFEGRKNWRKEYTASDACVSKRLYKGNRVKDPSMIPFFELIAGFEELVREHTSLICLSAPEVEGDDMMAGFCQKYQDTDDEIFVISGDKDCTQFLRYKNVTVIDPDGKKLQCDDPDFYMFEKCFRGDPGDNVMSAYPRLRKDKILKAFEDEYALTQLFNHEWTIPDENGNERTVNVGELWKENQLLMDLEKQPDNIRKIIADTIEHESANHGKFSLFHFQKFLGKYELKKISEQANNYVNMFSVTHKNSEFKHLQEDKVGQTGQSALEMIRNKSRKNLIQF